MKKQRKRIPRSKRCERCRDYAYLTKGKFYYCTNEECKHKDYLNISDKNFQRYLDKNT